MNIHFFDCPNCGKSLRVGARKCHHCDAVDENDWADPDAAPEFATGGYVADREEFDEFDEQSRPLSRWKRRAVIFIVLLLILSFLLQAFLPGFSPL